MDKQQNAKLNMMLAVQLVVQSGTLIWQGLLAFVNAFAELQAIIQNIIGAKQRQEKALKTYTEEKKYRKRVMAELADRIRKAVQAYATDQNDGVLYGLINYSFAQMFYAGGNTARTRAQIIYDQTNLIIGNLLNYGVQPQDLIDLQTAITDFANYIGKPKDVIAEIEAATTDLKRYFKDADKVLKKKMDKLIENFRATAPTFVEQYFNDRKIYDGKTNYTELYVAVRDSVNDLAMYGVLMHAVSQDATYDILSNTNGIIDKKKIKPGTYNLTFTKAGYITVQMNGVDINSGEKEELDIVMAEVI